MSYIISCGCSLLTTCDKALYFKASTYFQHTQIFLVHDLYVQLAYQAGTFIPFYIKIESNNEQALDLLANPKAIHVRVRRQITFDHAQKHSLADDGMLRESLDYSQRAVWWASTEENPTSNSRFFNGELHLKSGMKPNTELGHFKLSVSKAYLFEINY